MSFTSRASWWLLAPGVALLALPLGAAIAQTNGNTAPWWQALRLSAGAYLAVLAVLLFVEQEHLLRSPSDSRVAEVGIAFIGLCISAFLIAESVNSRSLPDLRFGAFGVFASGVFFVPRRTEIVRALAFVLMAIATFRLPVVAVHPLYISVSALSAAAAVFCAVRITGGRTMIRRAFSVGALLSALMTAMSIGAFRVAYEAGSTAGLLISSAAILFFGIGTFVIVTRGDWFERHSRR